MFVTDPNNLCKRLGFIRNKQISYIINTCLSSQQENSYTIINLTTSYFIMKKKAQQQVHVNFTFKNYKNLPKKKNKINYKDAFLIILL